MYVLYDDDLIVRAVSSDPVNSSQLKSVVVAKNYDWERIMYKKLPEEILAELGQSSVKSDKELRIAIVCNWGDRCGISTYTKYLVDSLAPKVKEIKLFSEMVENPSVSGGYDVEPCWARGGSLLNLVKKIKAYRPDFVIVQHEYGIFPNAFRFMQLMQGLEKIPHVVVMHSVYKHLDKAVYSECAKNIMVHTREAESTLRAVGNTSDIYVVPHGCVTFSDVSEVWNICVSPYTILQFGFGFSYKGVDRAIRAVAHLKATDPKFKEIQYIYLCSTNGHSQGYHSEYCKSLMKLAEELGVLENIVIVQKYQTDGMINLFLRLAKIAIFPYVIDPNNEVFGASGAIRVALANHRPVIASESHLFDDLEGVVPRPTDHLSLAKEIDSIFSSGQRRDEIIQKGKAFVEANRWELVAEAYLQTYREIAKKTC